MILDKLDRLSRREKLGLAAALILLGAAAADNFAARPILRTLRDIEAQIELEANRLAYNRGALRWEEQTTREYERVRSRLAVAASVAEGIADMKGQIDTLARKNSLAIQKMDHRDPKVADGYAEYTVQIGAFEADLRSALRFLHDLWQAPGMLRIARLSLTPGAGKDAVKGSMTITKLMLIGAAGSAPASATEPPATEAPATGPEAAAR